MLINIDTDNHKLNRPDAVSLMALILATYPDISNDIDQLATGASVAALPAFSQDASGNIRPLTPATDGVASYAAMAGKSLEPTAPPVPQAAMPAPPAAPPPPTSESATHAFGGSPVPTVPSPPASSLPSDAPAPQAGEIKYPKGIDASTVDSAGQPWDPDIHAMTGGRKADGTWRLAKGRGSVEEAEVATAAAKPAAPPPPPPVTAAPPPPPPVAAPPATPTAVAAPAPAGNPFVDMMKKIQTAMQAGQVTVDDMNLIYSTLGIPGAAAAASKPELIAQISANVDAYISAATA